MGGRETLISGGVTDSGYKQPVYSRRALGRKLRNRARRQYCATCHECKTVTHILKRSLCYVGQVLSGLHGSLALLTLISKPGSAVFVAPSAFSTQS
jgi:hypothetical protein